MKFENPSSNVIHATRAAIVSDMRPGKMVVHSKVLSALFVGGGFALLVCAQFGNSLSPLATNVYTNIDEKFGHTVCAILSAVVYMTFALISLRLMCSRFQFRFIINKHSSIVAMWTALLGTALSFHSEHAHDFETILAWVIGAITLLLCVRFIQVHPIFAKRAKVA